MGIVIDVGEQKKTNYVGYIFFLILVIIFGAIAWFIPYFMANSELAKIETIKNNVENLKKDITTYKDYPTRISDTINRIKLIYNQLDNLKTILNEITLQRFILVEFPHILPTEAWINNLSVNFDSKTMNFGVNIVGEREKVLQNVSKLIDNMSNSVVFKDPKVSAISLAEKEGETVANFNVDLSFDYNQNIFDLYYKNLK
ncbi:MAG: PilN domain-containing protein [bacterium]